MFKFRRLLLVCTIALLCLAMVASAQDAPAAGRGGFGGARGEAAGARGAAAGRGMRGMFGGRGGGVRSPELASVYMATFRLSAPDANSVSVRGDWGGMGGGTTEMTKDENGVWSATVGPLESEMYGYTFIVDGASVWDPSNMQLKRDGTRITSVLIVPGGNGDLYTIKPDVPHGTLSRVWYPSPSLNLEQRRVYVYTPPGYETSGERYPVFYLLHGAGGDEDAWTSLGKAPQIFDNMIAQGTVKPMIVVMTNGNSNQVASQDIVPAPPRGGMGAMRGAAAPGAARGEAGAGRRGAAAPAGERGAARGEAGARRGMMGMMGASGFPESIVADLIPFIDKSYRTLSDQANRAIAGLSMGSMHTRAVTLAHPDTFAYYGLLSGSTYTPEDLAEHKDTLKYVLMTCGERESMPVASAAEALTEAGFNAASYISPGSAHDWLTWRRSLIELAPHLFQE